MGFLNRRSRKNLSSITTFGEEDTNEYIESYIEIFSEHIHGVIESKPITKSFFDKYFGKDQIADLGKYAFEKMSLTQSDNKEHSVAIYEKPVCYQICTVVLNIENARNWFVKRYGGYTKLLEQSWQTEIFIASKCKVLCHIVFGQTNGNAWVQLAVVPVHKFSSIRSVLLPIELLTPEERRISGL